jgi:hypothetical protein
MTKLTLHFESAPGTDLDAAAVELQKNIAAVNGVESANATPQRFQSVGTAEILSVIKVATEVAQSTAALLGALAAVYAAWKSLAEKFPGLRKPTIEVGLKKVPIDQVTPEQAARVVSEQ